MSKSYFFKEYNIRGGFSGKNFLEEKKTVCVKYKDGHVLEHHNITDPWRYIVAVKKNLEVESAWIKE